ncbi:uncharacterized protein BT62DRAFT_932973 [Guyanagaster necrorhizus]|uniref:Uncharacterized protein n=1 Tax=Guyanagaster necrorhizus TaxID=856835 RepID=A0A9P7VSF7_9AGAR|nr:uncharacterized protein BT62DRAFT_932973 [Guyanagaster necrorhizus MCA 3950]KAG7445808.1 hypothetical protein BT62DRAFT_932973 [Guyanagaster necrorhizus MCA 3950]
MLRTSNFGTAVHQMVPVVQHLSVQKDSKCRIGTAASAAPTLFSHTHFPLTIIQFKPANLVSVAFLASSVAAICPGYNYGIIDLGYDVGTGKEGYAVVDDSCNQVAGAITTNVCDEPLFSCSPAPITITGLHYGGQNYACRGDVNSGSCNGAAVQVCCRNDGN